MLGVRDSSKTYEKVVSHEVVPESDLNVRHREIERRFPGQGLRTMLGQLMPMQKRHLESLDCAHLDYFHNRFDAVPVQAMYLWGIEESGRWPRFSCMRVGSYVCRLSKRCKSAECRGRLQSMRPTSKSQTWIHQSNVMSSRWRIYKDYSIILQSPPNGLPTIVKLCCEWCKEKTRVEGDYSLYEDKKAEWTRRRSPPALCGTTAVVHSLF